jgi:hypothetical protein
VSPNLVTFSCHKIKIATWGTIAVKTRRAGLFWQFALLVVLCGCQQRTVGYHELTAAGAYMHTESSFTFPTAIEILSRTHLYQHLTDAGDIVAVYGGEEQEVVVILHLLRGGSSPTEKYCKVSFDYMRERIQTQFEKVWIRQIGDTGLLLDAERLQSGADDPDVPLGWEGPLTMDLNLLCIRMKTMAVPDDDPNDHTPAPVGLEIHRSWHLAYSITFPQGKEESQLAKELGRSIEDMWRSSLDES